MELSQETTTSIVSTSGLNYSHRRAGYSSKDIANFQGLPLIILSQALERSTCETMLQIE